MQQILTERARSESKLLRQLLSTIDLFLDSAVTHEFITSALRELEPHLRAHFELEDELGFHRELLQRLPNDAEQIQRLKDEHQTLLAAAHKILEDAKKVATEKHEATSPEITTEVREFFSMLRHHEEHEDELLLTAHMLDEGVAD